ncbi:MAG: single-stranded DNA-binding protein [Candidatus Dojkabacteria bacterium]|nr:single-stranded DNA-binding protein [Candidatus Dojkabacteria bacterium]
MRCVNKVILIGNLVRNPEVTIVNSSTEVARFSIAINESYKKQDGTAQEIVTYLDVEAWGGLAKIVGQYLNKGSKVYVEGTIRTDSWTDADTGKTRTKYKIRAENIVILDKKESSSQSNETSNETNIDDIEEDDDLPF